MKGQKLSRRALLSVAAASTAAAAQQPSAAPQPPADETEAARRALQEGYEQMRKTALPRTVEPATVFRP